ncbi:relaxase/mobilization nuclease domain-containing protein [Chryseobacterium rhizosphaerae]|uniref:relaxase/mobilization nuclease domain-containing protein n=1 Tax=Chryseobacterium rhizosphaerae TaxID=395937 RepID=UPI002359AE89|nr:relaxase/mobilization nuclease domain-containing protein [Chryseobacterium rhizosphaerae]MDC8102630.1 relaxase/mobilization nuclease domain-containing protein [Chryseobacterium rhizosphaerae]
MIVKILNRTSKDFNGVIYNDKKIDKGKGELLVMKNFPTHINSSSGRQEVKNYFKAISNNNKRVQNPQFHCTISAQGRSYSKEQLALTAEKFMDKMGYGEQPYIVVFHNDTSNNHVHIVSSRVDKHSGKRIERDFEKYKSQTALQEALKELYGTDVHKKLDNLLEYSYTNTSQLQKLLEISGYGVYEKENTTHILCNGLHLKSINTEDLKFSEKNIEDIRKKQIFAIFKKYKGVFSNSVFKVADEKGKYISYQSELQYQLKKKFGIDVVLSFKDDKQPFGYTIIDHKTKAIYKGSEIMKMGDLFKMTSEMLDKKLFEILANSNITIETKEAYKKHLEDEYKCEIRDYMIFLKDSKKTSYNTWKETRNSTMDQIRNFGKVSSPEDKIKILSFANELYVINRNDSAIFILKELVTEHNQNLYLSRFLTPQNFEQHPIVSGRQVPVSSDFEAMLRRSSLFDLPGPSQPTGEEHENNRRKKKKKR